MKASYTTNRVPTNAKSHPKISKSCAKPFHTDVPKYPPKLVAIGNVPAKRKNTPARINQLKPFFATFLNFRYSANTAAKRNAIPKSISPPNIAIFSPIKIWKKV